MLNYDNIFNMMKKLMVLSAALLAFTACTKESFLNQGDTFEKDQIVTLKISTPSKTKVSSTTDGATGDVIFKWEDKDSIKVTVGTTSSVFIVSKLIDGGTSAEFTGKMPAGGDKFNVQFPVTDPTITSQLYSSTETIPHNMMKFTATGCTIASQSFTLSAAYAGLRLNLYGEDQTIGKIVVKTSETYTLNISPAITLPTTEETAKVFIIVIPAGSSKFTAELFDNSDSCICEFGTSEAKTFNSGQILNMAARKVGKFYPGTELEGINIGEVIWAPVNCGYDKEHPYGLLYQFGRNNGQAFTMETKEPSLVNEQTSTPESDKFYYGYMDWKNGESLKEWPTSNPGTGIGNPCPDGWCVPSIEHIMSLSLHYSEFTTDNGIYGRFFSGNVPLESSTKKVFLPAGGYRNFENGDTYARNLVGDYWSSFADTNNVKKARMLEFSSDAVRIFSTGRAHGATIRCISKSSAQFVPVSELIISDTTLILYKNQTSQLSVTVLPATADFKNVTWSSSDESIATVSSSGLVTAIASGKCTITAESYNGIKVHCVVRIVESKTITLTGSYEAIGNYKYFDNVLLQFWYGESSISSRGLKMGNRIDISVTKSKIIKASFSFEFSTSAGYLVSGSLEKGFKGWYLSNNLAIWEGDPTKTLSCYSGTQIFSTALVIDYIPE